MNDLIESVLQWGRDKGITGANGKATILTQLTKTQEELTETRDAAIRLEQFGPYTSGFYRLYDEIKDGIGDCTVTLILAAELAGLSFEECLQCAYDEIKGRTGKMIDGTFVKDGRDA